MVFLHFPPLGFFPEVLTWYKLVMVLVQESVKLKTKLIVMWTITEPILKKLSFYIANLYSL